MYSTGRRLFALERKKITVRQLFHFTPLPHSSHCYNYQAGMPDVFLHYILNIAVYTLILVYVVKVSVLLGEKFINKNVGVISKNYVTP